MIVPKCYVCKNTYLEADLIRYVISFVYNNIKAKFRRLQHVMLIPTIIGYPGRYQINRTSEKLPIKIMTGHLHS